MPNRILHERICVSETIAQLSADEERFFYRLIVQCDDYGRFDGRASVVRARCFALQLDRVSDADVAGWLARLVDVGLVVNYSVEGRAFLRVTTWERYQQTRAKRSKFPDPDDASLGPDSTCMQAPADAGIGYRNPDPGIEKRESKSGVRESSNETRDASASGGARTLAAEPAAGAAGQAARAALPPRKPHTTTQKRMAQIVDLVREAGVAIFPTARDGACLKSCAAPSDVIAEAYVAAFDGNWDPGGDGWLRANLSLHAVIERVGGYEAEYERKHAYDHLYANNRHDEIGQAI